MTSADIHRHVLGERLVREHRREQLEIDLADILRTSGRADQVVGRRDDVRRDRRRHDVERGIQRRIGPVGKALAAVIDAHGELEVALRELPHRAREIALEVLLRNLVGVLGRAGHVFPAALAQRLGAERIPGIAHAVVAARALVVRRAIQDVLERRQVDVVGFIVGEQRLAV